MAAELQELYRGLRGPRGPEKTAELGWRKRDLETPTMPPPT